MGSMRDPQQCCFVHSIMDLSDHSESDEDYDPTKDTERDKDEEEGAEIRPLEGALKRVSRKRYLRTSARKTVL